MPLINPTAYHALTVPAVKSPSYRRRKRQTRKELAKLAWLYDLETAEWPKQEGKP